MHELDLILQMWYCVHIVDGETVFTCAWHAGWQVGLFVEVSCEAKWEAPSVCDLIMATHEDNGGAIKYAAFGCIKHDSEACIAEFYS